MFSKEISKRFHRTFRQLFVHNVHLNGLKSALYCFGLSASRYIEYASALTFLSSELKASDIILEIGCGHSILLTLWAESGLQVVTVDISRDALRWQINKSRKILNRSLHAVLADGKNLPFKGETISVISCISAIEHVPGNGDIQVAYEIGRVLKPNGLCIASFSLSPYPNSYSKKDWAAEIPPLIKRVFKSFLPIMFNKFKVDRTPSYFERFYSLEDVHKRIILPSRCIKEDHLTLRSGRAIKFIYERIIPTGVLAPLEFLMARFLTLSKRAKNMDAIILKMRKPSHI